jgi:hypothetical protein
VDSYLPCQFGHLLTEYYGRSSIADGMVNARLNKAIAPYETDKDMAHTITSRKSPTDVSEQSVPMGSH